MKQIAKTLSAVLSIVLFCISFRMPIYAYGMECDHDWVSDGVVQSLDGTYHGIKNYCTNCGEIKYINKEKHRWTCDGFFKEATLFNKGSACYECKKCGDWFAKTVSWKRGTPYSADYDPLISTVVYSTSKTIKIRNYAPKGSVMKVSVGGKTYKRKVKGKKWIKIKLKKQPVYGKKIKAKVYYKKKLIGSDWDYVYYAKGIRIGMTKKQVKWVTSFWRHPNSKASAAGGWSFWDYDNGSSITFKNGKVKDWYNAKR